MNNSFLPNFQFSGRENKGVPPELTDLEYISAYYNFIPCKCGRELAPKIRETLSRYHFKGGTLPRVAVCPDSNYKENKSLVNGYYYFCMTAERFFEIAKNKTPDEAYEQSIRDRIYKNAERQIAKELAEWREKKSLAKKIEYEGLPFIPDNKRINFEKNFVLTGGFTEIDRKDLTGRLYEQGGLVFDKITDDVNYIVVGSEHSKLWSFGNFGSKIEAALKMKTVKFVKEKTLVAQLIKKEGRL